MNKKNKVIFLGKLPPPYIGPAVAAQYILNSRLKEEFDLIHLDTSDHRDIKKLAKLDLGNLAIALKQYYQLIKLLILCKAQMVYIPSQQTTIGYLRDVVFIIIAKAFGKKVLCHLRGGNFRNWYLSTSVLMKWIVVKTQKKIDGQIILGENLRPLFNWCMPNLKIHVVPNGANYKIEKIETRNEKRETEKIRILYLGNFIASKGYLDTLYSSMYLKNYYEKIEFVFAGNWRDEKSKKEFENFTNNNKNIKISMVGPVTGEEKFKLLASADIFVFPTYYPNEGHPWVIIEALATGLPIISTDHAAINQSVINNLNGYLVEKKNPTAIAEKIALLIDDNNIRIKMGSESRRLYEQYFTGEIMINKLISVFYSVLKN